MNTQDNNLNSESQAELQLIHSLLLQAAESDESINNRIDRTLLMLDDNSEQSTDKILFFKNPKQFLRRYSALGSIAASLLMCGIMFFIVLPSNVVMASIDKIIHRLDQAGDRMYRLQVDNVKTEADPNLVKPRLLKGKLYLRNTDQFLLIGQRDNDSTFIKARNKDSSWQLSGKEKRLSLASVEAINLPISGNSRELIFLDLASMLEAIKDGYKIHLSKNITLATVDGTWSKIDAKKIDKNIKGAKHLSFYFDSNNFELQRIVLDRVHLPGDKARVRITLDLMSSNDLPMNFFEPSFHCINGCDYEN